MRNKGLVESVLALPQRTRWIEPEDIFPQLSAVDAQQWREIRRDHPVEEFLWINLYTLSIENWPDLTALVGEEEQNRNFLKRLKDLGADYVTVTTFAKETLGIEAWRYHITQFQGEGPEPSDPDEQFQGEGPEPSDPDELLRILPVILTGDDRCVIATREEPHRTNLENKLAEYLEVMVKSFHLRPGDYVITIPGGARKFRRFGVSIGLRCATPPILTWHTLFWENFFRLVTEHQLQRNALRAALSGIMGRNMSHNIGSHVLSRLGRTGSGGKWFTQRYLQQRMDFLAQVTTEWPDWEEPAWLLQDIVRWFLHQSDVLDNIAASEQLKAHYFCDENMGKVGDIRFHVFMVPVDVWNETGNVPDEDKNSANASAGASPTVLLRKRLETIKNDCISSRGNSARLGCIHKPPGSAEEDESDCHRILFFTPKTGEAKIRTENDVQVNVPGGIVGYQAFYVILENVIRNAAKHNQRNSGDPLHVVVEVAHDPDVGLGIELRNGGNERSRVPAYLMRVYDSASVIDAKNINCRLRKSLIDEVGALRRENWGLSEMKVAAAFLQRREIQHIGDGGDDLTGPDCEGFSFLEAAKEKNGSPYIMRAIRSPIGTLGYEFYMLRPRVLGIVSSTFSSPEQDGGEA